MAMAFPFYFKAHGATQGDFKGDSLNPRRTGRIDGLDFEPEIESPRDPATGQASGKRQWKPIAIVKRWSASSPQFLQALATNEVLSTVDLEFESVDASGKEVSY
jgi:type VI secretion system secreted protein Hcp